MDGTGEILKSGALADATNLFRRLAGPAFEEIGVMLGDSMKVYRTKNFIRVTQKTSRILEDAGLLPKPVPSRLLLPIIDSCSVEDDDDLQERWAGLLASASEERDSLSPSFIETLKQLTPKEARHCEYVFVEVSKLLKRALDSDDEIPYQAFSEAWETPEGAQDTYERLGLIRRDYRVKVESDRWNVFSDPKDVETMVNDVEQALDNLSAEIQFRHCFTDYAIRFLMACRGPRKVGG